MCREGYWCRLKTAGCKMWPLRDTTIQKILGRDRLLNLDSYRSLIEVAFKPFHWVSSHKRTQPLNQGWMIPISLSLSVPYLLYLFLSVTIRFSFWLSHALSLFSLRGACLDQETSRGRSTSQVAYTAFTAPTRPLCSGPCCCFLFLLLVM